MIRNIMMASEDDKEQIFKLYKSQIGREYCPWDEYYPGMEEIEFDLSKESLFVMKAENGELVAAVSIDHDDEIDKLSCWTKELTPGGELSRLAVSVEYQNQGIAQEMLKYGMSVLRERGYKSIHFLVNKTNEKALRSYNHLNFNNVGECFMFGQPFWCYEKKL